MQAAQADGHGLPASCVSQRINYVGAACFAGMVVWLHGTAGLRQEFRTVLCLLAIAVPIVMLELLLRRTHRNVTTGLDLDHPGPSSPGTVAVKLMGLAGTLAVLALIYWAAPEYHVKLYRPFWKLLAWVLPPVALATIPYFFYVDRRMSDPHDGYWHAGCLFLGRWRAIDRTELGQHARGWLVKGFFLPLMFAGLTEGLLGLWQFRREAMGDDFFAWFYLTIDAIMTLEIAFACTGYCLTVRLFDSHIRSTEPTLDGWMWTLICYPPFWLLLHGSFLHYDDGHRWGHWFAEPSGYRLVWAAALVAWAALYAASSMAFGIRFSNLTNRGIVTNGPYRLTKHPAYVAKCLTFWMVSMPFLSAEGPGTALRNSLLLLGLTGVYYGRARTEERHLSRDPTYVAYALAMNRRSIFRWVGWLVPWARFRVDP